MANVNFNKIILGGRLTAEPELKQTQSTGLPVTTFSIAVNRRFAKQGEKKADFFRCRAWRDRAELICRFFHKGSSILIAGSLQNGEYVDQQGQKRTYTEVQVDEVYFVDTAAESAALAGAQPPQKDESGSGEYNPYAAEAVGAAPGFEQIDQSEELPF